MTRLPLQDLRIVAVEQYGAGPWGTMHLADLGADVIKVEDPRTGGDIARYVPPYQDGEDSLFFESFNRNKRSISLDLITPAGRKVFEDLVRQSDAVYSNLRGDVPRRLRLCYDDLKDVNPKIVCCSLSAYGMTGPRSNEPGYDYMVQGLAGWMSLTGEPDGPPQKTGLSLVDFSGGYVAGFALLAGLHSAQRTGIGLDCDLSLFETALSMLNYQATWYLTKGHSPTRTRHSAHPSLVPFQNFKTADGWVIIACPKDKFFERLVAVLELEELIGDPRYQDFLSRGAHRRELLEILEARVSQLSSEVVLDRLMAAGVPCSPVNDVAHALQDPQVEARGLIVETEHPGYGTVRQIASPLRVGALRKTHRRAPARNEHAREILSGLLHYDDADIQRLAAEGAFGTAGKARLKMEPSA
jgi:crotonobetainyl-CoA:carnitine CoA-transferase CaiB-like acyl-CoA transferase